MTAGDDRPDRSDAEPEQNPAPAPLDDEWSWRRPRLRLVAAIILLLVIGTVLVDAVLIWRRVDRVTLTPHASPAGGTTYLLVGTDSRAFVEDERDVTRYGSEEENPGEGADVMLAVRVRDDGSTRLLAIPRDLILLAEDSSPMRATAALQAGPQELLDTLCRSIGLGIDHYVAIRFPGLREVVNSIGGVEVEVEHATRDEWSGLALQPGVNVLDGDGVLSYVGSRRAEVLVGDQWIPDPELSSRSGKAAGLLAAIARRIDPSPWHPVATHLRLWAISGALAIDDDFGVSEALDLRSQLGQLDAANIRELPVQPLEGSDEYLPMDSLAEDAGQALRAFDGPAPAKGCVPRFAQAER